MKKALTFLAISTLSLASVEDFADDGFNTAHHGTIHHAPKPVSHNPHLNHHSSQPSHTSHLPGKTQTSHVTQPTGLKQDLHGHSKDKKDQKHDKQRPEKNPSLTGNKFSPSSSKQGSQSGAGSGSGMDLKPLFDLVGGVVRGVVDHLAHGRHGKSDNLPSQQALASDSYTIGELESFFEYFKNNKSGLNKTYDEAWAEWQKIPNKNQSTYKDNSDKYTVEELGSFFSYMKMNQKHLPAEFDEAWDEWKNEAHDNSLFDLQHLLKNIQTDIHYEFHPDGRGSGHVALGPRRFKGHYPYA